MKKILNVYEMYEIKGKGYMLAGTNEMFDSLSIEQIRNMIGKRILLKASESKKIYLVVLEVDFSNSILNKKNIFILVNTDAQLNEYKNDQKLEAYAN